MPTEVLRQVKKLELMTRHLVDGLLQGAYHSVFKGRGIEFSEVREYVPGDDVRAIDWNITARMDTPYVKEFIEERDLNVFILLDVSGSNDFGSRKPKKQSAVELSASLMFAAMRNNDNIGLVMFTDKVERYIPARKGRRHVLRLIRDMIHHKPEHRGSGLHEPLVFMSRILKRKSIIFIVSDFMCEENYAPVLRILRKRHDVVAVRLRDIREREIPDLGFIELEDEETGEQVLIDTSDPYFRKGYEAMLDQGDKVFAGQMDRLRIDWIDIQTDRPYEVALRQFFNKRLKRLR